MNKVKILESTPSTISDAAYEMPDRFSVELEQTPDGQWKASGLGFEAVDSSKAHSVSLLNQKVREALKDKKIHF